ncbi:MAG: TonB-dependent receptor [Prevotella sp.]|nr:TonB-dependent receptor [Prevotella sp.]MCM1074556.1 TonB-dependent receptor [Ruminococcus sp.]
MKNISAYPPRLLAASLLAGFALTAFGTNAPQPEIPDSASTMLDDVVIVSNAAASRRIGGVLNGERLGKAELFKAACCNLGESFSTSPSVDVSYSDAATGARQIKLLGLPGTYVQLLTENLPAFRGAAAPYALRYVPGPWMKSIQVSKGVASVKNGYEAMTGQIDIEYLKPQDPQGVSLNAYFDSNLKLELNGDANWHISSKLNSELLAHFENSWGHHDVNNDGFADMPHLRQYNLYNRWNLFTDKYIFHAGIGWLKEDARGGQIHNHANVKRFRIDMDADRYEAYMKHAFILNREHNTNIALMANTSMHQLDAVYGLNSYNVNEKALYSQLLFEHDFNEYHNLAAGLSLNYDYLSQLYRDSHTSESDKKHSKIRETTPGIYAQYTLKLEDKLTAMAGIRYDRSSIYGSFVTPRFHVKYAPSSLLSFRASAGKGYRSVFPLAEHNYLLASGRTMIIGNIDQEKAWNFGISSALNIPLPARSLRVNLEYYYTRFGSQTVVDYDSAPFQVAVYSTNGLSYSHTFQIDATCTLIKGLDLLAAYRFNDVKTTYADGRRREKPLTSRYKALLTLSYATPLKIWQFDVTCQLNGPGRMPTPYSLPDGKLSWDRRFPEYFQLNAQITRWFRHFSIYLGGENLTNFRLKNPIINASDPWSQGFDPTMVWGPIHGAMAYAGIRFNLGKL